jgi:hypothetical protein
MGVFEMVVIVVFLSMVTGTVHKYLDTQASIAKAGGRGGRSVLGAIEELRAEIAALKQQETNAVLSFDSTLQTLDARVRHLERLALGQGSAPRAGLAAGSSASTAGETQQVVRVGETAGEQTRTAA